MEKWISPPDRRSDLLSVKFFRDPEWSLQEMSGRSPLHPSGGLAGTTVKKIGHRHQCLIGIHPAGGRLSTEMNLYKSATKLANV